MRPDLCTATAVAPVVIPPGIDHSTPFRGHASIHDSVMLHAHPLRRACHTLSGDTTINGGESNNNTFMAISIIVVVGRGCGGSHALTEQQETFDATGAAE